MRKQLLIYVFFSFISTNSFADWSGSQTIKELFVRTNYTVLKLKTSHPAVGCSDISYLTLEAPSDTSYKEKFSVLLAARMAGKTVDLNVAGCGSLQPTHGKIIDVRMLD